MAPTEFALLSQDTIAPIGKFWGKDGVPTLESISAIVLLLGQLNF
ncbi:hypothetical protein ACVBIO_19785 [Shewanella sp. 0m-8]